MTDWAWVYNHSCTMAEAALRLDFKFQVYHSPVFFLTGAQKKSVGQSCLLWWKNNQTVIFLFFVAMTEQCKTLSTNWYRDFKKVSVMLVVLFFSFFFLPVPISNLDNEKIITLILNGFNYFLCCSLLACPKVCVFNNLTTWALFISFCLFVCVYKALQQMQF